MTYRSTVYVKKDCPKTFSNKKRHITSTHTTRQQAKDWVEIMVNQQFRATPLMLPEMGGCVYEVKP